MNKTQDLLHI